MDDIEWLSTQQASATEVVLKSTDSGDALDTFLQTSAAEGIIGAAMRIHPDGSSIRERIYLTLKDHTETTWPDAYASGIRTLVLQFTPFFAQSGVERVNRVETAAKHVAEALTQPSDVAVNEHEAFSDFIDAILRDLMKNCILYYSMMNVDVAARIPEGGEGGATCGATGCGPELASPPPRNFLRTVADHVFAWSDLAAMDKKLTKWGTMLPPVPNKCTWHVWLVAIKGLQTTSMKMLENMKISTTAPDHPGSIVEALTRKHAASFSSLYGADKVPALTYATTSPPTMTPYVARRLFCANASVQCGLSWVKKENSRVPAFDKLLPIAKYENIARAVFASFVGGRDMTGSDGSGILNAFRARIRHIGNTHGSSPSRVIDDIERFSLTAFEKRLAGWYFPIDLRARDAGPRDRLTIGNLYDYASSRSAAIYSWADRGIALIYGLKFVRFLAQLGALWLSVRIFRDAYVRRVYANRRDPPSLKHLLYMFVGMDLTFQLMLVTTLVVVAAPDGSTTTVVNDTFMMQLVVDSLAVTLMVAVLGGIVASYVRRKTFFHYKHDGFGAIKGYADMLVGICAAMVIVPFFMLV